MIIHIDFNAKKTGRRYFKITEPDPMARICRHHQVCVDQKQRMLYCEHCGTVVDPFDYVLSLANKESGLFKSFQGYQLRLDALKEEYQAFKKKMSALKAQEKVRAKAVFTQQADLVSTNGKDKNTCLNEIKEKLKP